MKTKQADYMTIISEDGNIEVKVFNTNSGVTGEVLRFESTKKQYVRIYKSKYGGEAIIFVYKNKKEYNTAVRKWNKFPMTRNMKGILPAVELVESIYELVAELG